MRLLGLDFTDVDCATVAGILGRRPAGDRFCYVTTPNADHLVRLHRQPALLPLYQGAMLRLLDSRVVGLAAEALGLHAPCVVRGSDLTARLLSRHARGDRVTIVGLSPRWLPVLCARYGIVAAHHDPPRGFDDNEAAMRGAVDFVLAHPARFVFLAVGSPRQEKLAAAISETGRATGVGLCVGASLEFVAGARCRAPRWMQQAGLEWLHRLAGDPRRMARRYLVDCPAIFPLLLRERLAGQQAQDFLPG